jgi:hypothetical protein
MPRTFRLTTAAVGIAVLTGCNTAVPQAAPVTTSPPVPAASSPSPSRSAAPATTGPKLVDANLTELKSFEIDLGVPVVIVTSPAIIVDRGKVAKSGGWSALQTTAVAPA